MLLSTLYSIVLLALQTGVLHCFQHRFARPGCCSLGDIINSGERRYPRHGSSYKSFFMNSKDTGQVMLGYGSQSELRMQPQITISSDVTPSLEMYACEEGTQDLVIGQIASWIRAEVYTLREYSLYSVVLASVDGDRVAHIVGWKSSTRGLSGIFNNFRRRADGVDGTPAALKESTHLYNALQTFPVTEQVLFDPSVVGSYPLISLDVFNNYRPDKHADMTTVLKELTSSPATLPIVTIPTFKSMHILSSTDSVVSVLLGVWKGEAGFPLLQNNDNYRAVISKAKKMSVRGTYSDLVKKIDDPSRLYYIVDFVSS